MSKLVIKDLMKFHDYEWDFNEVEMELSKVFENSEIIVEYSSIYGLEVNVDGKRYFVDIDGNIQEI